MGDAVEKAYSGHLGLPMGCAPMPILFDEIMRYNPKNPYWFNRDGFVLSVGHDSIAGYDSVKVPKFKILTLVGLKKRSWLSKLELSGNFHVGSLIC